MPAAADHTAKPGGTSAARASACLHLAAAPSFALMALATMLDASPMATMCSGGGGSPGEWSLGGMTPMYLLMAAFHLGPWLEMVSGRRRR